MSKDASSNQQSAEQDRAHILNHDQPIIINNSSVLIEFDGDHVQSYDEIDPSHYQASGHRVSCVVISNGHNIPLPEHGNFTVRVHGMHPQTGHNSIISITSRRRPPRVEIRFNPDDYTDDDSGPIRQRRKNRDRHVRGLVVRDDDENTEENFSGLLPQPNEGFDITIEDRNH